MIAADALTDPDLVYDPVLAARLQKRKGSERGKARDQKIIHILSVAVALFAREGNRGFSTRRIAADAGVTLSTLQHYFGSRENLLTITVDSLLSKYIARFVKIARDPDIPPPERLNLVADDLLNAINDPIIGAFYAHLWATAAHDPEIKKRVRTSYETYYDLLTVIVSAIRPDLPLAKASILALSIGAQIDGLLVARLISPASLPDWPGTIIATKRLWQDIIAKEAAA